MSHGNFAWYELMTTDTPAAEKFYGQVVGWGAEDAKVPGIAYTLFTVDKVPAAGLMDIPERVRAAGGRPAWMGHVAVDDVDRTAAAATAAGATLHRPPTDIPGVGRFAVIADPQSAVICLFQGTGTPPPKPPGGTPGYVNWNELHTTDPKAGFAFYAGLFGWTKSTPIDMGPMGIYQIYAKDGLDIGGMMAKQPTIPMPFWQYYFNVADIKAAAAKVTEAGGQVLFGPQEVPGGQWVINGLDPQGAVFALVAPG